MKLFLLAFVFVFSVHASAQSKKIADNIAKLNNSQFIIDHNAKANFKMNSPAAMKLIRTGKKASDKLILTLDDADKVIMAHLILCHIYFSQVSFAGPKIFASDKGDINKYYLGEEKGEGLIISEFENKKYIETSDLEKIKIYWTKKVKEKDKKLSTTE
jgi:hypothetical protein